MYFTHMFPQLSRLTRGKFLVISKCELRKLQNRAAEYMVLDTSYLKTDFGQDSFQTEEGIVDEYIHK